VSISLLDSYYFLQGIKDNIYSVQCQGLFYLENGMGIYFFLAPRYGFTLSYIYIRAKEAQSNVDVNDHHRDPAPSLNCLLFH
jgi:hypothetical protein